MKDKVPLALKAVQWCYSNSDYISRVVILITWLMFLIFYLCLFFVLYFYVLFCEFYVFIFFYRFVYFLNLCCLLPIFVQVYWPLPTGGSLIAVNKYIIPYLILYYETLGGKYSQLKDWKHFTVLIRSEFFFSGPWISTLFRRVTFLWRNVFVHADVVCVTRELPPFVFPF